MAIKQYEIVTRRNRSKKIFRIKKSGIRISWLVPNGGKELEKDSSEEQKIRRIAEVASARDLWEIRMLGFLDIATQARQLQNTWNWNKK
ncbi:uncharacterized protein METZ01_LOCUS516172 [marine metagenome]|uniref:Uncharacterized protein n=1 Tax=marine metagenome TaxID=408172 RepID=A0A383F4L7_9ZZZZ